MECRKEENLRHCTCTYPGCSRKGVCCECVVYHRERGEIPGCLFSPDVEKSFNRSVDKFVKSL